MAKKESIFDDPRYRDLYEDHLDVLTELHHMRDFVFKVSAPERSDGSFSNTREDLKAKANELLNQYEL